MNNLFYTGQKLQAQINLPKTGNHAEDVLYPYLPDPGLVNAVNMAIALERPLLLMGEPGCGKSRFASALAHELYHDKIIDEEKQDYRDWFFEWNIKSDTRAKDGIYHYDALRRLLAAQAKDKEAKDINNYIEDRPLSKAFKKSISEGQRAVLLIDEIDKADFDFPNDLLNELDRGSYTIPETNKKIVADKKPIIIITSNREKELSEAFLRRCIYHFIKPFTAERLKEILLSRFHKTTPLSATELLDKAIEKFEKIRTKVRVEKLPGKNISTSELIDWYNILKGYHALMHQEGLEEEKKTAFQDIFNDIKKFLAEDDEKARIPLHQALFKNIEILQTFVPEQTKPT